MNAAAPDLPMYKATLDRNLEMKRSGIVSQQALDDANNDYLAALTRRDSAKAQIGVDTAKLKQAHAQVLQSQASLKQLEEQLSYTTIVAPMDGVILSRDVEIGDAVSSILVLGSTATLVMTEGDINQVYVQGKVDEADIAHVYMGQPARIKVESFRDRTLQRQGDQDRAAGRGERQRDDLRGARLDRQSGRRAEGQHDGQRRDHCWMSTRAC